MQQVFEVSGIPVINQPNPFMPANDLTHQTNPFEVHGSANPSNPFEVDSPYSQLHNLNQLLGPLGKPEQSIKIIIKRD